MIGIDTNVLARFFLQDDEHQSRVADRFMRTLSSEDPGFVSQVVLVEFHWVLRTNSTGSRKLADECVQALLEASEIEVEDEETVHRALVATRRSGGDFTDALIADTADLYGCDSIVTFDRRAATRLDFQRLR